MNLRNILLAALLLLFLIHQPTTAQQRVVEQLTEESLGTWIFEEGRVTGAFQLQHRRAVKPGRSPHVRIAHGGERERNTGQRLTRPGGNIAVLLGDDAGVDSWGASARGFFRVDRPGMAIVLHLMAVLQDPGHRAGHDPFVRYELRDAKGRLLNCGSYKVESASTGQGWVFHPAGFSDKELKGMAKDKKNPDERAFVHYLPWTEFLVPLMGLEGQEVSLEVMVGDCQKEGHWGLAAFDLEVVELALEQEGRLSCESPEGVRLSAPPGARHYAWSNGMSGQEITMQEGGDLRVDITTMSGCGFSMATSVAPMAERAPLGGIHVSGKLDCDAERPVVLTAPENMHGYRWSTGAGGQQLHVTAPGTYTVQLPGAPGRDCTQEATVLIEADYSMPDPDFKVLVEDLCEGRPVLLEASPMPAALARKLRESWSMDDGTVLEGPFSGHTYAVPGTKRIVRRYVRGQCSVEAEATVVVHPNPQPGIRPEVRCTPEKYFALHPEGADTDARIELTGAHCEGTPLALQPEGRSMTTPLAVDSCYRFRIHVTDRYGCEGEGELTFTPPPDPEVDLEVLRVPPVNEVVFAVLDSSRHVAERIYGAEGGVLEQDSVSGIAQGVRYPGPGEYLFSLHVSGVPFTCPDSLTKVLRVPVSLRERWGPQHPRPVAFDPTRIHRVPQCPGKPQQSERPINSGRIDDD
ncbi:MAG TPA: hypothetical protein PKE21_15090 [Flavobacteriales bacterium]|nr:hypothetical protein [Flavobacteriales bacterium]HMR28805.1 hypothetical protein [Flavobacteriales bacterium]